MTRPVLPLLVFLLVLGCVAASNDGASASPTPAPVLATKVGEPVVNLRRRDAVVEVVERVSPAVVYVGTKQIVETRFRARDPFFDEFFGDVFGPQRREVESLGSGVIVSADGTVVTNDHVIRGASEIHVVLADGKQLDAEVVGSDPDNDLAVLRVKSAGALPFAKLGTSSDLMIGETVIAIGSPFGLQKTVTVGVLSATGRSFRANDQIYNDFLQTDASINPGNSGGPLLNVAGDVVGINTAIYAGGQGIGFAIPADKVTRIVRELEQFGKVRPAWVGLEVQKLTRALADQFGWDRSYGVVVTGVEAGSPAEAAGIRRGDLIASVSGTPVNGDDDFDARMRGYPAKSSMTVEVFRDGKNEKLTLTPIEFPAAKAETLGWDRLGIRVGKASAEFAGLPIAAVRAGSPAARTGLQPGDVLLRVNNQPLAKPDDFRDALVAARTASSVLVQVRRGRGIYHITLPWQRS